MKAEIISCVAEIINSGQYVLGEQGRLFEKEVCQYLNSPYTINVANGTDALVLALRSLDIGVGDEVITTPFTFFATAEAISRVKAIPVFVDIDPVSYNMDPKLIEAKITNRTKAIIPVHLFGKSCHMEQISKIAKAHNLYVIEDACQAFGGEYNGEKLGAIGDVGCFSFFPTKNLSTFGDGGLVVTKHKKVADRIKRLRHHGSEKKYFHEEVGYNSRLDEVHAAVLRLSLQKIDQWNETRIKKAGTYSTLADLEGYTLPQLVKGKEHVYHLYCLEHNRRDDLIQYLNDQGIASGVYYPLPLHLQNVYKKLGYQHGDFPVAELKSKRLLALPMHPFLKEEEQQYIIEQLRTF